MPGTDVALPRMAGARPRLSLVTGALVAGVVLYSLVFTAAAWYKYHAFRMGFDLAVHEQVLWNSAHGRIGATSAFASTENYLGIDIILTELLLTPLYALAPSVHTMLLIKTVVLALGAIPVFWMVRDRFEQPWAGLVFAAAYLLYLPVQFMNLYEFQIRAFATTFLLFALHALERRRTGALLASALLALGCRSEAGLVLAGMALLVRPLATPSDLRRDWLLFRILPAAIGLGWFVLCLQVLIPWFRNGQPSLYLSVIFGQIDGQPWLGSQPGEILRTLVTRPGFVLNELFGDNPRAALRLRYLWELFAPWAFLVLLQPRLLLATAPIVVINLLSNTPNIHASIRYHYNAFIIPFLVIGAAYGLHWLLQRIRAGRRLEGLALAGVVVLALGSNLAFGNPLVGLVTRPVDWDRIAAAHRLIAQVPPDAALTATNTLGPHAARRQWIFFFPGNVIYPAAYVERGHYLLIDAAEARPEGLRLLAELEAGGRYVPVAEDQGISLWRRTDP